MLVLLWAGGASLMFYVMLDALVDCDKSTRWTCSRFITGDPIGDIGAATLLLTFALLWWINRKPRNKGEG